MSIIEFPNYTQAIPTTSTETTSDEQMSNSSSDDWRARAACAAPDVNPEWFFPAPGESQQTAKRICGVCPVRAQCLAWAQDHEVPAGIFGGMSADRRRKARLTQRGRTTEVR